MRNYHAWIRAAILSAICLSFLLFARSCGPKYEFPFLNPELSVEQRVDDLVGRMSLEEKIGQMMNAAPAIDRLHVPEYNWWNECLHGVARAGLATVFPQAIGMAASWDEDMMFRVASAISDEARAKHQDFIRKDKRLIYQGLTFWSPNINIFRDPRWGRGQETYGEDPFLTGRLAVRFIRGLQGNDPEYFKTIATVKHYAVHSGPEPERHSFNAVTSERDLRETYLPQFKMGVREGGAYSVMCAYNRYMGEACCGSDRLLNEILREEWGFKGYVVSDCGAIGDIYRGHHIVETPAEAAALAVRSGCDLECATVYTSLKEAVERGLITEDEIDVAVKRLFTARFRLGMFDPPEMVEYAQIPYEVVDCPENRELALESARKSMVLLKNRDSFLPLDRNPGTIAVIGPNADDWRMLLGNYNGLPADPVTPLRGIREKLGPASEVLCARGCELAEGIPTFGKVPPACLFHGNGEAGLRTDYYRHRDFSGGILYSSVDSVLDADWEDRSPRKDMDDDDFGVIWTGQLKPVNSGKYQLGIITTCKVDLYLDDSLVVNTAYHFRDEFSDPRLRKSPVLYLEAGRTYNLRVEAGESYGIAQVQLVWAEPRPNPGESLKREAIETASRADLVILCMGLSARLEGEEMDVHVEGFEGGDRTRIDLPDVQEELIREICALGKPVVLVLLNGSALAVNWEDEHIPAILEAWYPGQAAGQAIADVLFGDYNPAGRLPVTFYRSVKDLPPFEDYNMKGRTYRYFKGEPLYPFGYGLSYTSFRYSGLELPREGSTQDTARLSVNVSNTGEMAGDEVVQVYLAKPETGIPVALHSLVGFRRIRLEPGETMKVDFRIPPEEFSVIDNTNKRVVLPGNYRLYVGGGQPGTVRPTANILEAGIELKAD
jgi:beta-glucosidase